MENLCPRGDMIRKVLVANRGEIAIAHVRRWGFALLPYIRRPIVPLGM